jgi:hypothetical protein|tara:strand:+ start:672 stop:890 length:219 start_codon:yes stop_codon:yes gene_type:complete
MAEFRVIRALKAQANADREKALMVLELLTESPSGIGDHTSDDFLKDATTSLKLLASADERLETLEKYFNGEA